MSSSDLRSASTPKNQAMTPPSDHDAGADEVPDGQRAGVLPLTDEPAEDVRRRDAAGELGDGEEERDRLAAQLQREDLADGEVGRRGAAEAKKKMTHQKAVCVVAVSVPLWKSTALTASRTPEMP
jgi:hypothetical protein